MSCIYMSEEKTNNIVCFVHLHISVTSISSIKIQVFNDKSAPLLENSK